MVPSYHLTFTSQKGTPLLVHPMLQPRSQDPQARVKVLGTRLPMLATLGHRSGYLQDGAIVPSDLLISQRGTPLLVHPMLHPNIGSPRDAATLGEIGSAFPTTQVSPLQSVFLLVSCIYQPWRGGGLQCCYPYKIPSSVAKQPNYHCWYSPHVRAWL